MKDKNELRTELHEISKDVNSISERVKRIEAELNEPEFKVGQYVIGKEKFFPRKPERIKEMDATSYTPDEFNGRAPGEDCKWNAFYFVRPATPSEIETHLKKILNYKGYKAGVRIKCVTYPERHSFTLKMTNTSYDIDEDKFFDYSAENSSGEFPALYSNGKFADILPSLKKKPETREEFNKMLTDFAINNVIGSDHYQRKVISETLDKYDIK